MHEIIIEDYSDIENKIKNPPYLQLESRKFFYNKIFNIWKFYSI